MIKLNQKKFNFNDELETFPGELQTEFQQNYPSINDGEEADKFKKSKSQTTY